MEREVDGMETVHSLDGKRNRFARHGNGTERMEISPFFNATVYYYMYAVAK